MANEVADHDEEARAIVAAGFARWQQLIANGLRRMQENGKLKPDADADHLAIGLIAALQGGYLLTQTTRDMKPMEVALDMALSHIKAHLVE